MNYTKINLAVTPGAPNGVGPELFVRALKAHRFSKVKHFYWCQSKNSLINALQDADIHKTKMQENQIVIGENSILFAKDFPTVDDHHSQALALNESVKLAKNDIIQGIVTGPIEKKALSFLPGNFVGQTEFFAHHLGKRGEVPFMAFMGGPFILSLFTTHMPLRDVGHALTKEKLIRHCETALSECAQILNKSYDQVRVAVLGLNPHAGENGLLGYEENEIIVPALNYLRRKNKNIFGPLPADGYFSYFERIPVEKKPDLLVAMYHDQGLIPYKILANKRAVNVTMGLTIPRVSPAHGTAMELKGKKLACPLSTINAISCALKLCLKD